MSVSTEIRPIRSKKDYNSALRTIEALWDAPRNSRDGDALDVLSTLVEKYEEDHFPISSPDPIEAIKFRMDQMGMNQTELGSIIGGRSRASEVLSRKRPLTLSMIRSLSAELNIPSQVLIKEYSLK